MLSVFYPYGYMILIFGWLLGIGLGIAFIGFFSAAALVAFTIMGMIRIGPLLNLFQRVAMPLVSSILPDAEANLRASFQVRGEAPAERSLFLWHPHGLFCTSHFFHVGTRFTNWSHRNMKMAALSTLTWMPFMSELFETIHAVPSDYASMKKTLESGVSLSVAPGGMREMLYPNTALLENRKGVFRLALETGTPLVPVVSVGEERLYSLQPVPSFIQNWLKPYGLCLPLPTVKTFVSFLGMLANPLKTPVTSVIGDPVRVERVETPTDADVDALRTRYIAAVKALHLKETGKELAIA